MYFAPISQATKYNYLDDKFQAAYIPGSWRFILT